jgi:hypothetical protein
MNTLRVELKICEGCGVLWLRSGKTDGAYCRGCAARLAEFPAPNPGRFHNRRVRLAGSPRSRTRRRPCRQVGPADAIVQPQPVIDQPWPVIDPPWPVIDWTGGAD